jgi:hypothetical protein
MLIITNKAVAKLMANRAITRVETERNSNCAILSSLPGLLEGVTARIIALITGSSTTVCTLIRLHRVTFSIASRSPGVRKSSNLSRAGSLH